MSFIQNIIFELRKQGKLTLFIILNIVLFLFINISAHVFNFNLISYLALPINFFKAILKFWTIFTYMFSHEDVGHLFYNMILLYFNGRIFCNLLLEKRFTFVYIVSGISGALFLLTLSFFINQNLELAYISGASAATIGVISALAMYTPNLPVNLFGVFEIRYKYFAMVIFALFTIIDFSINTGGKISHFGGALFGLLYGYMLKNGNDLSLLSFYKPSKKTKLKVVHNSKTSSTSNAISQQKLIDAILDKISKNGYENLSKTEKELLFKFSQKK
jgi:membrane associated rhomboid family serine protease